MREDKKRTRGETAMNADTLERRRDWRVRIKVIDESKGKRRKSKKMEEEI